MKESSRLLKTLVYTAIGVIIFSLTVLAILNFTSVDKKAKNATTSTTSQNSTSNSSNKKSTTENNNSNNNSNSNTNSSSTKNNSTENKDNNKSTNNNSNNSSSHNRNNSNSNSNSKKTEANNSTNTNNNASSNADGAGNTGKIFSTQAEAHAYGKAEIERIVKETKKYTSYEIKSVRDANGNVTGWTVNIFQDSNNPTGTNNSGN